MRKRLMKRIYGHCFDTSIVVGKLIPCSKVRAWWFVNVTAPLMDKYWRSDRGITG